MALLHIMPKINLLRHAQMEWSIESMHWLIDFILRKIGAGLGTKMFRKI